MPSKSKNEWDGLYTDRDGQQQWEEETCDYLVKRLSE